MDRLRWLGAVVIATALVAGCSKGNDSITQSAPTSTELGNEPAVVIANAPLTVRNERNAVIVNGTPLVEGAFQTGAAGDVVTVDPAGTAFVTAESVFEIEALRSAKVTVPDLTQNPLKVGLEAGHVFVRLNAAADATVVLDTGGRQFTTRSPDAEFALCQAPNGASCLAVLKGKVEWNEAGVANQVYDAGQATFAARGTAPNPTRCADEAALTDMQRSLKGLDFAGALDTIVANWTPCDGSKIPAVAQAVLPSAAGMTRVAIAEATVGSPAVTNESENQLAPRAVSGPQEYYIEPFSVANSQFRAWVVTTAGDNVEQWRRLVPPDWLQRAPSGAVTQSSFVEGKGDESVKGVSYQVAGQYCAAQGKRLATEVQWELAAVNKIIADLADNAQDWVSDWQAYGPGPKDPAGRQVLRGANGTLNADPYYRVFAVEDPQATAARQNARIRCAADKVAIGGRNFPKVVFQDDFNTLAWPVMKEKGFELGYHPENYHLDVANPTAQMTVVRSLAKPLSSGRVDVDAFIERNKTGTGQGRYRFGTVIGTKDGLYTLTVQPDELGGKKFTACLAPIDPALGDLLTLQESKLASTSNGRPAELGPNGETYNQDCNKAAKPVEVPVTTIDSPVRITLTLVDGTTEAWVNEVQVDTTVKLSALEIYGFFSQTYNRQHTHIHFDRVAVTGP